MAADGVVDVELLNILGNIVTQVSQTQIEIRGGKIMKNETFSKSSEKKIYKNNNIDIQIKDATLSPTRE